MSPLKQVFGTNSGTKKLFVPINVHFFLRKYTNSSGKHPIYLSVYSKGSRIRINTEIDVLPDDWDQQKQKVKPTAYNAEATNLILENIVSKITKIKTIFMLSEKTLTAERLCQELKQSTDRVDFLVYFSRQIELEKKMYSPGYYRRVKTVLNKLKEYKKELLFTDINDNFEHRYRIHLANLGNAKTTINSNLSTIKKMLLSAKKNGIKLPSDPTDISIGKTHGNRTDLHPKEIRRFHDYYHSEFIPEEWKLVLGYFLFSCFTGMRWSDVIELDRNYVLNNAYINFDVKKTNKKQTISINKTALAIVQNCESLFIKRVTDVHVNRTLKFIAGHLKCSKKISFHVARHTFATNFLRMGGNVVKLQMLLGHSNIRETMIYVHIVEQEANDEMALMDRLL